MVKNFFSVNEVYSETFFQLPKVFFTNKKYIKMNGDTKIAYAILKDRFNYSIKNNWCDEQGHIYFIFTVKELQNILNCGTEKIAKIKKELENAELLYQKRMGLNQANRLYLLKPQADAQDVYLQTNNILIEPKTSDNKGVSKIEIPNNNHKPLDNKGVSKIEIPEKQTETLDNKGISKIENNLYKEYKDFKDTYKDTEKERIQNSILLENFSKTFNNPFLGTDCLERIAHFSNTIPEAQNTVGIIMRAKNQVEKENNTVIVAEYYQDEVKLKLTELYLKIKTDETIKSKDNYMFIAFLKMFRDFVNAEQAENFEPSFYIPIE